MRLRLIIIILSVFAFLSASAGGWLYYYSYREAVFEKRESDARANLNLLARQVSMHLSEHVKPVKTLSVTKEVVNALKHTNLESIYRANKLLDLFAATMDLDVAYLLDREGITLCSSNRNAADSFVGKDFSFRPYYQNALQGKGATYLALGTTSNKRGVYFSHPVIGSKRKGQIIGVAVIKASVEFLESTLMMDQEEILLFCNPIGLIFMSNVPEYRFKLMHPLTEDVLNLLVGSRQFGNGPWAWAGFKRKSNDKMIDSSGKGFLCTVLPISENYPDWHLIHLRDQKKIHKDVTQPLIQLIGSIVISVSILAGILVFILYRMASNELVRRREVEKKLKESEQRYREIYHKTPVMLHSIDTEARIIHVSDHWVEVMGYRRSEVIGEHLTRFFTEESKNFANKINLPKFFSTGFCKDIPYTYVKKSGETMDTLLSCCALRGGHGKILRSLAVSVDISDKNLVQKDLEKAKEALSKYSLDLEKQVRQRTAQLEIAQAKLKNLSKNIIASQEREKELIARELHDHLGQVLTALRIDAVWIKKYLLSIDAKAYSRADQMGALIESTIQDVRQMAYRLRPRVLDDLGLVDALESMVLEFEKRSNVSCVFQHDEIPVFDKAIATALYRICQEAMTNALRHSNATTIIVKLNIDTKGIILIIEDDGVGFDLGNPGTVPGIGLESMTERAGLAGGKLTIYSEPGKGTQISCKVSLGDYNDKSTAC